MRLKSGRGRRLEVERTRVIRRIPVRTTELRATLTVKAKKSQLLLALGMPTTLGLTLELHLTRLRGCVGSRKGGKDRGRIKGGAHLTSYTGHTQLDPNGRQTSIFSKKVEMSFWSQTAAAPSFMQVMGWSDRSPRYLRPTPPVPPPGVLTLPDGRKAGIKRLFKEHCAVTAAFLEAHYCAHDWRLTPPVLRWLDSYLRDMDVVALGLFVGDSELVGTIFATPLSKGSVVMSHGASLPMMRVIEGLCVHPRLRGDGVAAFLIKHMDSFVAFQMGTCAYLFSRELPRVPYFNTALRCDTYGYRVCGSASDKRIVVESMPWAEFERAWALYCWAWTSDRSQIESGCLVATAPLNRRGHLAVYTKDRTLAVISNTERVGSTGGAIYEVVWCGVLGPGQALTPVPCVGAGTLDFQQLLNGVAGSLPAGAVLFGSSSLEGGSVNSGWAGWTVGVSGVHAWYIYNYMPPVFGTCRIHAIRDEL